MKLKAIASLTLIGAVVASYGQVTKSGTGYLFRPKFTTGSAQKYLMKMSDPSGQTGLQMQMPFRQTVKSVVRGIATIEASMGPVSMGGKPMANSTSKATIKVDSTGKVVGSSAGASPAIQQFPTKPIKVNERWQASFPLSQMGAGSTGSVKTTYRFVRITTYKGKPAAELSMSFNASGQVPMSGSGKAFISMADGSALNTVMSMKVSQGASAPSSSIKITIDRL